MSIDLTVPMFLQPSPLDALVTSQLGVDATYPATTTEFVGYPTDLSWSREVRENADNIVEGMGGVHGAFYAGRLSFSLEVKLERASTVALSNARADRLFASFAALRSDGQLTWTEQGRVATMVLYRQQSSPRGPDSEGRVLLAGVCAYPFVQANTQSTGSPGSGLVNAGNAPVQPNFTFTTGASGTVVISRTSPSPTESLTLTIGGTSGLAASTLTAVDFVTKRVSQGSTVFPGAAVFPTSVWWSMAPGSNTISVTGGTSAAVNWRSAWWQ